MLDKLTSREFQVLKLMSMGHSNIQIAKILNISLHTVKAHVQTILFKFKAKNRVQAAVIASKFVDFDLENFYEEKVEKD